MSPPSTPPSSPLSSSTCNPPANSSLPCPSPAPLSISPTPTPPPYCGPASKAVIHHCFVLYSSLRLILVNPSFAAALQVVRVLSTISRSTRLIRSISCMARLRRRVRVTRRIWWIWVCLGEMRVFERFVRWANTGYSAIAFYQTSNLKKLNPHLKFSLI
jgi:hypothetical protein